MENLPTPPPGFITLPAPKGSRGYLFVPDPDGYLTAAAVNQYLMAKLPDSLKKAAVRYQEMYQRWHMCDYHIEGVEITEESVANMQYPAGLAEIVVNATQPLLLDLFSKKN